MVEITFYEKPGCLANRRQKALLRESGHRLEVRDLLVEPWTPATLRPFFGALPVRDWFNPSAPAVKSGAVRPGAVSEHAALAAMCADPLLIRRPLMAVGETRRAGFDAGAVAAWVGLSDPAADVGDTCLKSENAAGRSAGPARGP
ncbi:MAG: hypothetical protein AAGH83_06480 [Pseudomonadota bacterium]